MELSEETLAVYIQELRGFDDPTLQRATHQVIQRWTEPSKMPPIAFFLQVIAERGTSEEESRQILHRSTKPPEWDDLSKRAGISHEQVIEWLETARLAQAELNAKLAEDPEWQRSAARLGGLPGLHPPTLESNIPKDPEERKNWATNKAKEQGIL